jgi:hypothetical protein
MRPNEHSLNSNSLGYPASDPVAVSGQPVRSRTVPLTLRHHLLLAYRQFRLKQLPHFVVIHQECERKVLPVVGNPPVAGNAGKGGVYRGQQLLRYPEEFLGEGWLAGSTCLATKEREGEVAEHEVGNMFVTCSLSRAASLVRQLEELRPLEQLGADALAQSADAACQSQGESAKMLSNPVLPDWELIKAQGAEKSH